MIRGRDESNLEIRVNSVGGTGAGVHNSGGLLRRDVGRDSVTCAGGLWGAAPRPFFSEAGSNAMTVVRHLAIRCRDMERSRSFYAHVFGWTFIGYRPSRQGLDFTDGVNNITLLQQPADMQRPSIEEGNEYIHFGVIVKDLAACWRRCREWGAEISKGDVKDRTPIESAEVPQRSFKVLDPDGNVIDVTADPDEWRGVTI